MNDRSLLQWKQGAFACGMPVVPIYLEYDCNFGDISFTSGNFLSNLLYLCFLPYNTVTGTLVISQKFLFLSLSLSVSTSPLPPSLPFRKKKSSQCALFCD